MNEQDKILRDALMPLAEEEIAKFDAADARQHRFSLRYRLGMNRIYQNCERSAPNHHTVKRKTLAAVLIAAALLALLAIPISSSKERTMSGADIIKKMGIDAYLDLQTDTWVEYGDVSIYRETNGKNYDSVADFCEEVGVHVLYPSWLPRGYHIKSLVYSPGGGTESLYFDFSGGKNISYAVYLEDIYQNEWEKFDDDSKITITIMGQEVEALFIYTSEEEDDNDNYEVMFTYNGFSYQINSNEEETLFKIIDGLREN